MKTLTAQKTLARVQTTAEAIRNDETAEVGTVSVGDVIRQGDLYVVAIEGLPAIVKPIKNRQLAPGTSQGSRHSLIGDCEIFEADKDHVMAIITRALAPKKVELHSVLIGPVFRTIGTVELDHPEHGNRILPAGEVFAVVYQRAFADEVRRQLD